jgi:tRNA(His) 5'-end guanylyltransferase
MKQDDFGNRMKSYESAYNQKWSIRLPLILRFDGVHFHTQVKKWKCEKPFDEKMINAMAATAKYLCESISGSQIAYIQSDEITLLVRDDATKLTQPWFNKEINKVLSVGAAKATKAFIHNYFGKELPDNIEMLPEFDCRGFVVPEHEIFNVIYWRQSDASKNSIQMLARAHFSHNRLEGLNGSQLQELLFKEKGINWNDLPVHHKRGFCVVKKQVEIPVERKWIPNDRYNPLKKGGEWNESFDDFGIPIISIPQCPVIRNRWTIDYDIPIFSKDRNYIERFARLDESKRTEPVT